MSREDALRDAVIDAADRHHHKDSTYCPHINDALDAYGDYREAMGRIAGILSVPCQYRYSTLSTGTRPTCWHEPARKEIDGGWCMRCIKLEAAERDLGQGVKDE